MWKDEWTKPGHEAEQDEMMEWLKNRHKDTSSDEWSHRARRAVILKWLVRSLVVLAIACAVYSCAVSDGGDTPGPGGYWAIGIAAAAILLAAPLVGYIWNCFRGGPNGPY